VARTSAISFTLNDAPAASTLPSAEPNSVQLLTPEGVNLLTGTSVSGDVVSIADSGLALAGNTAYTVKLASTVGAGSGKTLATPFSFSFTTAAEEWAMPATNTYQMTLNSLFLSLATDSAGNVFSGVTDQTLVSTQMYSATAKSWEPATTIFNSPVPGGAVGSLNLTTTDAEPIATWVGYQANNNLAVYLSTFQLSGPGTGAWSSPSVTPIEPPGGTFGFLYVPTAVSQASGSHVLTLAARLNGPTQGIYVGQYDEIAQTWGPIQIFSAAGVQAPYGASVATAVDLNGNATVAWIDGSHVYATTKAKSSSAWPAPQQIDQLTSGSINSIALGAGLGGTALSWAQTSGTAQPTIEVARLGAALVTWSAPLQLDDGSSPTGALSPSIAIDNAGFIDISYTQTNTSNTVAATDGVFLVRFAPTQAAWSHPIRMSAVGANVSPTRAATAVDNAGNVQLLYLVGGGIASATYYVTTGTVFDPGIIDNPNGVPSGQAGTPYLVIGPDNAATGVWINLETSCYCVRADRRQ
jgi:hypothetical protein